VSDSAIVYSIVKRDQGWRIEASLPGHVSSEDRRTVISWFQDYRTNLRRLHPFWVTNFRSLERGYALEIMPVSEPREFLEKVQNLRGIWTDEIPHLAY